jgi:simple sugar transport system ATP-binding protein
MSTTTTAPALRFDNIVKRFGGVSALAGVTLHVPRARVTCVLGENGAGKSTLIRILAGEYPPSAGSVCMDDERVSFSSPRAALECGVATVFQDLALVPLMSVWRNFFLGREPSAGRGPFRWLDAENCRRVTRDALDALGIALADTDRPVGTLSGGQRQSLAIARAIHFGARILVLDEPTAALGVRQAVAVLDVIRNARDRGVTVILVTHSPRHAHAVGDHFVFLRQGTVTTELDHTELDVDRITELMAGP